MLEAAANGDSACPPPMTLDARDCDRLDAAEARVLRRLLGVDAVNISVSSA